MTENTRLGFRILPVWAVLSCSAGGLWPSASALAPPPPSTAFILHSSSAHPLQNAALWPSVHTLGWPSRTHSGFVGPASAQGHLSGSPRDTEYGLGVGYWALGRHGLLGLHLNIWNNDFCCFPRP